MFGTSKRDMEIYESLGEMVETIFYVDIVLVIDATQDAGFVNKHNFWKQFIIETEKMISQYMAEYKRNFKLRIKVMYFRDFYFDGQHAFGESVFYSISEDMAMLLDYISSIQTAGGGDIPESGLEALFMAMNADYKYSDGCRQIITLFTNAPAHPLEDYDRLVKEAHSKNCCMPVNYPRNIPNCMEKFIKYGDEWTHSGRGWIFLVAPDDYPWCDLEFDILNTIRKSPDLDYDQGGMISSLLDLYWGAIFGS